LNDLKNKLKQFRFMNGELTQQELAESMKLALLIARVFKVNVEEIFYLEGK